MSRQQIHNNPPPPLYRDTTALAAWLHERLGDDPRPLPRRIVGYGLDLVEQVVLALKGRRRDEQLAQADESLIVLGAELRMAGDIGLLDDEQLVYALQLAASIGRQIGGWMKSAGAAGAADAL